MAQPSAQQEFALDRGPAALCRALRHDHPVSVLLDGSGSSVGSWSAGPLVAIWPRLCWVHQGASTAGPDDPLSALDRLVRARRAAGGTGETGVLAILGYELLEDQRALSEAEPPRAAAIVVDRSVRVLERARALLTVRPEAGATERETADLIERCRREILEAPNTGGDGSPASCDATPRTSLPRERYLRAVRRVQEHIARGDIYQANLCQRFSARFRGEAFELYAGLATRAPAPHSAFVETPAFCLASVSPETFLRQAPGGPIETRPIKGTRRRGETPEADRRAAQALLESAKDHAELTMIVDLERNDLSRVCEAGSVRVTDLASLHSYATVHHLVARVEGRLRRDVDIPALVRATFPGGSISGAPKIRAMEILRRLEPEPRNFFTGSLLWFGDDGGLDSSILIRTLVFHRGRVFLGAGGGIVADSDPEQEWQESNDKARALAQALGFEPEELA